MIVSIPDIYFTMRHAGTDDETARHFCVIAMRETGGTLDTDAHNYDPPRDDSWGLFQLNRLAHPDIAVSCARDLECSVHAALNLLRSRGDWGDWYGDESQFPAFRKRVDDALAAYGPNPQSPPGYAPPSSTGNPPGPVGAPSGGKDTNAGIKQGVKDFLLIEVLLTIAFLLVAFGLWGIATGKTDVRSVVKSGAKTGFNLAKLLAL